MVLMELGPLRREAGVVGLGAEGEGPGSGGAVVCFLKFY